MKSNRRNGKVTEAIGLLSEAAKEKKERLQELVNERALELKERMTDQASQGLEILQDAKKRLGKALREEEDLIRRKAKEMDKRIRLNPWPVIGITAFSAFLVGLVVRKKFQKSAQEKLSQIADSNETKEQEAGVTSGE